MRTAFGVILLLLLVQCKPKSDLVFNNDMLNSVPDSVIAPDMMAKILTDIHLAESAVQEVHNDSARVNKSHIVAGYYADIFSLYQVDYAQFKSSYQYYTDNPLLMNYIYKEVTNNLSLLESKKQIK